MTTKDNLPEPVKQETADVVLYEPPTSFEVVDRGPGEPIVFNHFGDSFVGIFEDIDEAANESGELFEVARFMGADGKPYVIFPGAALRRGIAKLAHGQWARITYTFDVDTGKPSPMKCFTVEVGR